MTVFRFVLYLVVSTTNEKYMLRIEGTAKLKQMRARKA